MNLFTLENRRPTIQQFSGRDEATLRLTSSYLAAFELCKTIEFFSFELSLFDGLTDMQKPSKDFDSSLENHDLVS